MREREALRRYLEQMEEADQVPENGIDKTAVQAAMDKLRRYPEPEVGFMPVAGTKAPAYNIQTAVDAQNALIVAHSMTLSTGDSCCLGPMAIAARQALDPTAPLNLVADAGYSNGEQASRCEALGITPHIPAKRGINNKGDGTLFDRSVFSYQPQTDTYLCPAGQALARKFFSRKDAAVYYAAKPGSCGACELKPRCTVAAQRMLTRHLHDDTLKRMHERTTPALMRLRRSVVEYPFATLKYRIFGNPRFLLRGLSGARTEISLAVMAYNLKRMVNVLGVNQLSQRLTSA